MSEHHIVMPRTYFQVLIALMLFMALTIGAYYIHITPFVNLMIALAIAFTKVTLIVMFFMHVKYESKLIGLAVVSSVIWLAFLLLITMSDYWTRAADWHLFTR